MTPLSNIQPGAEILGTALENLKNGRSMSYASAVWSVFTAIFLLGILYAGFARGADARILAGALAARDPSSALEYLREVPDSALPLVGLRAYVEEAARAEAVRGPE